MKSKLILSIAFTIFSTYSYAAIPENMNEDYSSQIRIAKDKQLPMSARWKALTKAAELARYEQISEIKSFAKSKEWFMRNATLVALEKINVNHAMEEAQMLLKDKALVVRSAAVDVIASRYTISNRDMLAKELVQPYNFKKKQSLWIRPKIFNIIAAKATIEDRNFLTRYLFDTDEQIVKSAAASLERITDVHFDEKDQIKNWQSYVKKKGWL
jgi:HEAT repeat protein